MLPLSRASTNSLAGQLLQDHSGSAGVVLELAPAVHLDGWALVPSSAGGGAASVPAAAVVGALLPAGRRVKRVVCERRVRAAGCTGGVRYRRLRPPSARECSALLRRQGCSNHCLQSSEPPRRTTRSRPRAGQGPTRVSALLPLLNKHKAPQNLQTDFLCSAPPASRRWRSAKLAGRGACMKPWRAVVRCVLPLLVHDRTARQAAP